MSTKSPEERLGSGMNEYAKQLERHDSSLARRLNTTRLERFERVKELHLPTCVYVDLPLAEFLENPKRILEMIPSELLYVNMDGKVRERGLTREETESFIMKHCEGKQRVLFMEYYTNEYGGNIIVNTDQSIIIEFKSGSQGPISTGVVTPEYRIERDAIKKVFHYSFEDEKLRKAMYDVIKALPHDGQTYMQGYYEFQLIRKKQDGPLEPNFIDYDSDPAYRKN